MNYTDPFAVQANTPLSRTLRTIELQANTVLHWPEGYSGPDYVASINQVNASYQTSLSLSLPSATGANEGTGMLFVNIGQYPFVISDNDGTQLTVVQPGSARYLFCYETSSDAGAWNVVLFGQGTSSADAAALAGQGLTPVSGRLNAAHQVSLTTSNANIGPNDRAKVFAATGGSVTLALPNYGDVGNNFFFGVNNGGSGTVTIQPPTGCTIDGFPSLSLAPNESVLVFCSGTAAWFTIGYGRSTQFQFTKLVKDVSAGPTITLTSAEASNKLLQFIGTVTQDTNVVVPSVVGIYYVQCSYTGSNSLTVKTLSGSGVSLSTSDRVILYCDGTDVVSAQSVAVGTNLSIVDGSLSAPAIGFAADPNTGLYRADVETLGLVSNGQESARFNYLKSAIEGKLGIGGITDPVAQLHIKGTIPEALRLQGANVFMSFYDVTGNTLEATIAGLASELRDTIADPNGVRDFYIGTTKILSIDKTGITVAGTISAPGQSFASLSANIFTGIQTMPVIRTPIVPLGNVSGNVMIDMSVGTTFTCTVTGATTFSFKNTPPAGDDQMVYLKVTNGGTNAAFISGTKFNNHGVAPTFTAAGRDVMVVWYDPEINAYVVGTAFQDYK